MTKSQAYKLVENKFGYIKPDHNIASLCVSIPIKLDDDWDKYWNSINTERYSSIPKYFNHIHSIEEANTLRLLTLFFFIEDTYK